MKNDNFKEVNPSGLKNTLQLFGFKVWENGGNIFASGRGYHVGTGGDGLFIWKDSIEVILVPRKYGYNIKFRDLRMIFNPC